MKKFLSIVQNSLASAVLLFAIAMPVVTGASASADDSCSAPANGTPGVHSPTGTDSGTFTYQCSGQYAGDWTNSYYVYYPSSNSRSPLYSRDYQYDCSTGKWTMVDYEYSPAQGSYYSSRIAADTTPNQATNCAVTAPASGTGSGSTGSDATGSGNGISNTGNGSTNTTSSNNGTTINGTNNNVLTLNNGLSSQATTGNANVTGNTIGGSAGTGNATTIANIANLLQSTGNALGPNTAMFTANINGDVNGDFMFDPSAILGTGANSTNSTDSNNKLTVNQANDTDAAINDTVNAGSQSGDATVADNTKAGDATSGNAQTIVNLMNLINSTVSAGQSFVGTININGNLNGDILLPQNLLNQLLASTGPGSDNSASNSTNVNATAANNTNTAITNNINATAGTGNADASGNTKGGSAMTGNAKTNVTLLNLTGSKVVGADDLLVFVNVLGQWVGMIMNAPAGSTAASLGGGITSTGPNSTNSTNNSTDVNANSTTNNNLGITNTVNANAQSGNATVSGNTIGGSAKSGDADTAVNVLNIANTDLNLSNWFGVLFINVFGNWTGSLGVNTSAGDPVAPTSTLAAATQATTASSPVASASANPFAKFVSHSTGTGPSSVAGSTTDTATQILGAAVAKKTVAAAITPDTATHASYLLPAIGISIAAIMLIGERVVTSRKSHKA